MNEKVDKPLLDFVLAGATANVEAAQNQLFHLLRLMTDADTMQIWSAVYSTNDTDPTFTNVANFSASTRRPLECADRTLSRLQLSEKLEGHDLIEVTAGDIRTLNSNIPFTLLVMHNGRVPLDADRRSILIECIAKRYSDVAAGARAAIREQIVSSSVKSRDLTSFLHRSINEVIRNNFGAEAVSIFYYDNTSDALILGASTGISIQRTHQVKRADVRYYRDSKSWTARCFNENRPILEEAPLGGVLKRNTYGEDAEEVSSRVYIPLRVRGAPGDLAEDRSITDPVGVMRLVNLNKLINNQPVTILQLHLLEYLSELICVLARRYIRIMRVMHDQERATHGYSTDLLTIKLASRTAFDLANSLLGHEPNYDRGTTKDSSNSRAGLSRLEPVRALGELKNRLSDILAVQDNMAHQLMTVLRHSGGNHISTQPSESERCITPYKSVILRLLSSKKAISQFYSRPELRILGRGVDPFPDEFVHIPSLSVTTGTFMLAVRNIAENAAKYCLPGDVPKLDITWEVTTAGKSEHVVFSFRDFGMGISPEESDLLFREGFRGLRAKQEQLRGNGLGLAVSLRALREEGGDMKYIKPDGDGTIFQVIVKKWGAQ